ncbi:amino acid ABC transporter substrate-binding protein [Paucibacter sp. Y2R2-4]|uniref:amino acid ABC transporter substrate-binding protein n=1 Tax=Paucibacter sp. Y2R2-4 TaxID=2893553 RepID=UPI0021E50201|nr:amino acid ABC transporter substrate-binding protein [Paucibacter sp. Y2R2-4]MCV2350946.1 amino acid ABC transporter substrate-binding protein [Paucibacter sp. Y2R2-4]
MKKIFQTSMLQGLVCSLMVLAMAPQAASAQALDRIKKTGSLQLGFIDGAAPYSYTGADGKPAGYDIEVCQFVAEAVKAKLAAPKLNVQYSALKSDDAEAAVAQGKVDLLCTATVESLKRREQMSYSIPVVNGGVGVLLRKDAPQAMRDVLNGKVARTGPIWRATVNGGRSNHTYAVRAGTVTQDWVREQVRTLGVTVNAIVVDDYAKGIELVKAKQADAFFAERGLLKDYVERNKAQGDLEVLPRRFASEPLALAMGRNDDDFRLLVDTALSRLLKSKDFQPLYQRHFGPLDAASRVIYQEFALP